MVTSVICVGGAGSANFACICSGVRPAMSDFRNSQLPSGPEPSRPSGIVTPFTCTRANSPLRSFAATVSTTRESAGTSVGGFLSGVPITFSFGAEDESVLRGFDPKHAAETCPGGLSEPTHRIAKEFAYSGAHFISARKACILQDGQAEIYSSPVAAMPFIPEVQHLGVEFARSIHPNLAFAIGQFRLIKLGDLRALDRQIRVDARLSYHFNNHVDHLREDGPYSFLSVYCAGALWQDDNGPDCWDWGCPLYRNALAPTPPTRDAVPDPGAKVKMEDTSTWQNAELSYKSDPITPAVCQGDLMIRYDLHATQVTFVELKVDLLVGG